MSRHPRLTIIALLLALAPFALAQQPTTVAEPKPAESTAKPTKTAMSTLPANCKVLKVLHTDDFKVTGDGSSPAWKKAAWEVIPPRPSNQAKYHSRFKMLYSSSGVYVLFEGEDRKLSATIEKDFEDLWNEDAFEFFFWPDEKQTVYFEYEISPLNHELAILIPNFDGRFLGWRPWHYEGERKTRKETAVTGGQRKSGADITGWTAEVFIPYALLEPLGNVPPRPGTRWRANFYRCDYDDGHGNAWTWMPVGPSFHEFKKFGVVEFQ